MKNVIDLLQERGFIDQITGPELRELVMKPIRLYLGFDPTAESLHLGNLLGIVALAWFQKCGHVPFALIGGATGRIGDPSGKSFERPLLSEEDLARNVKCLTTFFHKILAFPEGPKPVILNNNEWLHFDRFFTRCREIFSDLSNAFQGKCSYTARVGRWDELYGV